MTRHIVFRVDAGLQIGTGHVMRCLVLAEELRAFGVQTTFICRPHQGHMADYIAKQGHYVDLLSPSEGSYSPDEDSPYANWRGASWQKDAEETLAVLCRRPASWLVVDHYALDARWEEAVRSRATGLKIMAIDGQLNRPHDCDMLLDPTYSLEGKHRWKGRVPSHCRLLVGPQYALLRSEFSAAIKASPVRVRGEVRRVVMAFGGVDKANATGLALHVFHDDRFAQVSVDVIVGAGNPHYNSLEAACIGLTNIRLHLQPSNVAELMAAADLALSAGGTMLLEQCYVQVPSLAIGVADNQIGLCQALEKAGAIVYLGQLEDANRLQMQMTIRDALAEIMQDRERLARMREQCRLLMRRAEVSITSLLTE